MTITNPLELPEIRIAVGRSLTRRDLVQCLQVCKDWYTSFMPLVWSTTIVSHKQPCPTAQDFSRHCHLIRDLTYSTGSWQEYQSSHCSNLTALTIIFASDSSPIKIDQYKHLRRVVVRGDTPPNLASAPFWKPAHHIHSLSTLELNMVRIDTMDSSVFWNLCTRLEALVLGYVYVLELPDKSMTFERLKTLHFRLQNKVKFEQQHEFFAQCPNLTSLSWCPWEDRPEEGMGAFTVRLMAGTWPKLCQLQFRGTSLTDNQLACIINGMPRVELLTGFARGFGPLSLEAMRPHFHTLRTLDIDAGSASSSSMVPELLASCLHLEDISVGIVMSEDILQGSPWACKHSLKAFSGRFVISRGQDRDQHQRQLFERISELRNLERLRLLIPLIMDATELDLRLGKGLEMLTTLRNLESFEFQSFGQLLTVAEVEWMIMHWRCLTRVWAMLDSEMRNEMLDKFWAAGIQFKDAH